MLQPQHYCPVFLYHARGFELPAVVLRLLAAALMLLPFTDMLQEQWKGYLGHHMLPTRLAQSSVLP